MISGTNGASFGDVQSLAGTGLYEYNQIKSINGNEVVLERQLLYGYDTNGRTQVVGFPIPTEPFTFEGVINQFRTTNELSPVYTTDFVFPDGD